jgi:predicted DNA-binding protein (MmcQ/YjbR family)
MRFLIGFFIFDNMITPQQFRELALSMPDAVEQPHFEATSFRVNKKIFATMHEDIARVCLMLTPEDQSVFCLHDKEVIYPVPNKWGQNGATYVELGKVKHPEIVEDALQQAYNSKAKKSK